MALHNIAVQTMAAERHVIICGYGRSGQNLARLLEQEKVALHRARHRPAARQGGGGSGRERGVRRCRAARGADRRRPAARQGAGGLLRGHRIGADDPRAGAGAASGAAGGRAHARRQRHRPAQGGGRRRGGGRDPRGQPDAGDACADAAGRAAEPRAAAHPRDARAALRAVPGLLPRSDRRGRRRERPPAAAAALGDAAAGIGCGG